IARHPGEQAVEDGVEAHPAEAHAPDRAVAEVAEGAAAGGGRSLRGLERVRLLDVASFSLAHAPMPARLVADVPAGQAAAEHGAHAGQDEREPPGVARRDQPRNEDAAERRPQGRPAVEEGGPATALVPRHPDGVELAAGGVDRPLRRTETEAG